MFFKNIKRNNDKKQIMIEINKIYNEDWLVLATRLEDGSIKLIITDPPFGLNILNSKFFNDNPKYVEENIDKWLEQMCRVLEEQGHCYIYVPTLRLGFWFNHISKFFKINNVLNALNHGKNTYIPNNFRFDSQYIIYCSKGKAKRLNQVDWMESSESWREDERNEDPKEFTYSYSSRMPIDYKADVRSNKFRKREHPNEKNQKLVEKYILLSSDFKDLVLDPFCGIGTICNSAVRLGRRAIGNEIVEEYQKKATKNLLKNKNIMSYIATLKEA